MAQKVTRRDRLQYTIDRTFSHGSIAIIAWLAALSAVLVITAAAFLTFLGVRAEAGQSLSLSEATWTSLLRTLGEGTMGDSAGWGFRLVMLAVTLVGIFVMSTLIGAITSGIDTKLSELGKGRSRVIESDHTLVLGWSPQVYTIVRELVVANMNRAKARIVILGQEDMVTMEDQLRARAGDTQNTRVICRTGSAIHPGDLDIVSIDTARSVIVLPQAQEDPDAEVIKTILAIAHRTSDQDVRYHVVAAIREPANLKAARIAAGTDLSVHLVPVSDLVARVIAQTCRQAGLSTVYSELLNFEGDEIYFAPAGELAGTTFGDALFRFEDSALLGLCSGDGPVKLKPPMDRIIAATDKVIAVSADDDTVLITESLAHLIDDDAIVEAARRTRVSEHTLVLGWNWRGPCIIRELDNYVAPGSTVTVVTPGGVEAVERHECTDSLNNLTVSFEDADPADRTVLETLDLKRYHHVIALSRRAGVEPQHADARTLITLLHLRDLAEQQGATFSIVTEMRDAQNQRLAEVARPDDFVVSDRLISLVLTQISENKGLCPVLDDLFDPEGCEVYLKLASDYVALDRPVTFATVVEAARRRDEIAFGYRIVSHRIHTTLEHGIVLNPPKSQTVTFGEHDRVIVLADD